MLIPNCNSGPPCSVVDESFSILFDDDTEHGHIFGDQSMIELGSNVNVLLTAGSGNNKQPRRTSSKFKKPATVSAWNGSCASFRGDNSNDILNLSSTLDDSNHSTSFLALQTKASGKQIVASSTPGGVTLFNGGIGKGKSKGTANGKVIQNDSRFIGSFLLPGNPVSVDILPRKPVRREADSDVYLKDFITSNSFELIASTFEEVNTIFESSESKSVDDFLTEVSFRHSISANDERSLETMDDRNSESRVVDASVTRTLISSSRGRQFSKEDNAPKCPSRGLSPPPN